MTKEERKEVFDYVLIELLATKLVRKYGLCKTNEMLTNVWMPRIKVDRAGGVLSVEV